MFDGSQPGRPPQTVESLTAALQKAETYATIFRQQRDKAAGFANDMQADLVIAQNRVKELEDELAALKKPPDDAASADLPPPPPPPGKRALALAEKAPGEAAS